MTSYNLLVTAIGSATALSVIKGARKQDKYRIKIIGTDINDFVSGRYFADTFYKVPKSGEKEKFVQKISEIVSKEKIDLVVPIVDVGLPIWSELKRNKKFKDIQILISSNKTLAICQDKYKTVQFLNKVGVPTIKTFLKPPGGKVFPLFIKPRHFGRATIDAYKIDNRSELGFYIKKLKPNFVIQEYIEGEEYTADCLSDLNGNFINAVIRKRIETKGGLSVKGEVVKDKKALEYCKVIVDQLKIPGVCNVQFFKKSDSYSFFEINPRFAGTHAFTIEAGQNTIFYILEMLEGKKIRPSDIKIDYGFKMVRFWDEIIIKKNKAYTPKRLIK
jgi:carbamoyl-phosphate synthase large subunit